MKILQANAGALTNFEVLDFLRNRGAGTTSSRVLLSMTELEFKVYDYLEQSPACNETEETIKEFVEKSKPYNLGKNELLNILNMRPSASVNILPIVEQILDQWKPRIKKNLVGLVKLVKEVLPSPPKENEDSEEEEEDDDEDEDEDS